MAKRDAKKQGPPRRRRREIRLAVIPEPEPNTRSVLVLTGEGTVHMKGPGTLTMLCGKCEAPMLQGVEIHQVRNLVFRCNACQAFNETLD